LANPRLNEKRTKNPKAPLMLAMNFDEAMRRVLRVKPLKKSAKRKK
jgi:hypothetical protein